MFEFYVRKQKEASVSKYFVTILKNSLYKFILLAHFVNLFAERTIVRDA